MIYAILKKNEKEEAFLFDCWPCFQQAIFNPSIEIVFQLELDNLTGKTYIEKKECLRNKAVMYSLNQAGGLSYFDLDCIQEYFERYGRRYGLLSEFHENAIC